MARFILDANVSHETGDFLRREFQAAVLHISSLGLSAISDDEIVELAIREQRTVITFDLDFGQMHRQGSHGAFGAIVLRLDAQTIEAANERLGGFFTDYDALRRLLVILEDRRIRVINAPR